MTERSARVEQCIQEAECIRESIDELAQVQVQVASRSVGLFGSSSSITLWLSHLIVLKKRRDFLCSPIRLFLQISLHSS